MMRDEASDVVELLERGLKSENASKEEQDRLLREIEQKSAAILDALEESYMAAGLEEVSRLASPEWVSRVYAALAGPDIDIEPEAMDDFAAALAEEDEGIGRAFDQVLLADPQELARRLEALCEGLPPVKVAEKNEMEACPSLHAAGSGRYGYLPSRGLSPLRLFEAIEAVAGLFVLSVDAGDLPASFVVTTEGDVCAFAADPSDGATGLTEAHFVASVGASLEVSDEVARPLAQWVLRVAEWKPFLFEGFCGEVIGEGQIRYHPCDERFEDLQQRWASGERIVPEVLARRIAATPREAYDELRELGPKVLFVYADRLREAFDAAGIPPTWDDLLREALEKLAESDPEEGGDFMRAFGRLVQSLEEIEVAVTRVVDERERNGALRDATIQRIGGSICHVLLSLDQELGAERSLVAIRTYVATCVNIALRKIIDSRQPPRESAERNVQGGWAKILAHAQEINQS